MSKFSTICNFIFLHFIAQICIPVLRTTCSSLNSYHPSSPPCLCLLPLMSQSFLSTPSPSLTPPPFTPSTHTFTLQKALYHSTPRPKTISILGTFFDPLGAGGGALPCFCFVLFLTCKGLCILVVELILIQPVL